MKVAFPCQPFDLKSIDSDFADEYSAAQSKGWECVLYDHELIEQGDVTGAFKAVPKVEGEAVFHRGWMLNGHLYRLFYTGLSDRGYAPLVAPEAYEESHYLPLAYALIAEFTARSVWMTGMDEEEAWAMYQGFATGDALIKDWVKSAKYRWSEACFIPSDTTRERFGEIFKNFLTDRGKLFNRGVVLREYLPFLKSGEDMRGFPLIDETRLFFWRGQLLVEPLDDRILAQRSVWESIAARFQSPFISMDVAPLESGEYRIVEVGDGGVSGLPAGLGPVDFYSRLSAVEPLG